MTACTTCYVVIHKFCGVKHGDEGEVESSNDEDYKCFTCAPRPVAATTGDGVEPATQASRSFSGTFGPTRIKPVSRVSGPRSALTSFFEEQGISVPRNLHQYARSNQADADSTAPNQPRRARQAVSDVVADAHRRARSQQQQATQVNSDDDDDDDCSSTTSPESDKKKQAKRTVKVCKNTLVDYFVVTLVCYSR